MNAIGIHIFQLPTLQRNNRLSSMNNHQLQELLSDIYDAISPVQEQLTGIQNSIKENERRKEGASENTIRRINQHLNGLRMTERLIKRDLNNLNNYLSIVLRYTNEDKKGGSFSRERETNNGNLRMLGGADNHDDDDDDDDESEDSYNEFEFPYHLNSVLDVLEQDLEETNDDDERRTIWRDLGVDEMVTESLQRLDEQLNNGTLHLTQDDRDFLTQVRNIYIAFRTSLFPDEEEERPSKKPRKGGARDKLTPTTREDFKLDMKGNYEWFVHTLKVEANYYLDKGWSNEKLEEHLYNFWKKKLEEKNIILLESVFKDCLYHDILRDNM
jgi:hypothetical protein